MRAAIPLQRGGQDWQVQAARPYRPSGNQALRVGDRRMACATLLPTEGLPESLLLALAAYDSGGLGRILGTGGRADSHLHRGRLVRPGSSLSALPIQLFGNRFRVGGGPRRTREPAHGGACLGGDSRGPSGTDPRCGRGASVVPFADRSCPCGDANLATLFLDSDAERVRMGPSAGESCSA